MNIISFNTGKILEGIVRTNFYQEILFTMFFTRDGMYLSHVKKKKEKEKKKKKNEKKSEKKKKTKSEKQKKKEK